MSPMPVEVILLNLVRTGLESVGCRVPVEQDGEALYVRTLTLVVTDLGRILCYDMHQPEIPVFDLPMEAVQAAAEAAVVRVLSGIVARAIEADELSRL